MHHRLKVFAISAAALALIMLGVAVQQGVFAQDDDSPPTPSAAVESAASDANAASAPATDASAESAVQYLGFLESVAANLGISDPMAVDSAVKTMLTQLIDERLTAGELSDTAASALKTQIDDGNVAPLLFSQPEQDDSGGGSDVQTPSDTDSQQDDGSGAPQAPTESPGDDGYDYNY